MPIFDISALKLERNRRSNIKRVRRQEHGKPSTVPIVALHLLVRLVILSSANLLPFYLK